MQEPDIARPKTPDPLKKSEAVRVRLTVEERVSLIGKAEQAGLSVSEYLRRTALGLTIKAPAIQSGLPFETRNELQRIGVNLNQMAKVMNSGGQVPPASLDEVMHKLDVLFDHIFTEMGYL